MSWRRGVGRRGESRRNTTFFSLFFFDILILLFFYYYLDLRLCLLPFASPSPAPLKPSNPPTQSCIDHPSLVLPYMTRGERRRWWKWIPFLFLSSSAGCIYIVYTYIQRSLYSILHDLNLVTEQVGREEGGEKRGKIHSTWMGQVRYGRWVTSCHVCAM